MRFFILFFQLKKIFDLSICGANWLIIIDIW